MTISEDEFWDNFKPIKNRFDDNAGWNGCLHETYGEEKTFCFELAQKENRVWTIIECDSMEESDDDEYDSSSITIISGFHWVNRMGFLVTEKPYNQDTEVKIED